MGSIVTMQTISLPGGVSKYLLIDEQQRPTTILILLAVIRDRARQKQETNKLAEQINNTILINPYEDDLERYKLQPTQADRPDFHQIINGGSPNPEKSLINDCYLFFDKKISQKENERWSGS